MLEDPIEDIASRQERGYRVHATVLKSLFWLSCFYLRLSRVQLTRASLVEST